MKVLGFVLLCLATFSLLAFALSAVVGAGAHLCRGWLRRLTPAAQSRVLFAAAIAPAFVSFAVLAGWTADLAIFRCAAHHCLHQRATVLPSPLALCLALALLCRIGLAGARACIGLWRSRRTRRALDAVSVRTASGWNVVPVDEPQAFVLGVFHPAVYVSRGLLARAERSDVQPVLAHERAHARRRDPLRRLCASVALALHLPGIASRLERALARAHEMAADAEAVHSTGDGTRVAAALVRLARLRLSTPAASPALAWSGGDLEARVHDLLDTAPRQNAPRALILAGLAIGLLLVAILVADPIHSGVETILDVLAT